MVEIVVARSMTAALHPKVMKTKNYTVLYLKKGDRLSLLKVTLFALISS